MDKLGIIVNSLSHSQLSYFLLQRFSKPRDTDVIVFYENPSPLMGNPNFALMQVQEIWGYDGTVIATSLSSATKLSAAIGPTKKIFYVWDLEWLRTENKDYNFFASIYRDENLKIIARSKDHKKVLEDAWNIKVLGIVDDFDIDELKRVIDE